MSASSGCEVVPAPNVPLLQPPESVVPERFSAPEPKGDELGKVLPGNDVAVCENESTLTKRTVDPSATLATTGA